MELTEARRRIAKLVKQVEEDDDLPRSVLARLKDLEREEEQLEQELANLPERAVVKLPANCEVLYRAAIATLDQHLTTRDASASRNAIRTLIEAVIVHDGDNRGGKHRRLELRGDLFAMLEFAEKTSVRDVSKGHKRQKPQHFHAEAFSRTPLVAGAGFGRCRTRFRLTDHYHRLEKMIGDKAPY